MLKKLWRLILRLFNFKDKGAKVPQGLEVYDETGSLAVGTSTKLSMIVDRINIPDTTGSITVANDLFLTNEVYVLCNAQPETAHLIPYHAWVVEGNECTIHFSNIKTNQANPPYFMIGVVS